MDTGAMRSAVIAANLQRHFPDLDALEPITVLGSGFRSIVFEAAGARIFRVGKNMEAAVGYAKEARLLPLLQSQLPVPVPSPRWYAEPAHLFPFGVIGYPKVPGEPLAPDLPNTLTRPLAAQLGQIMRALHRFP